MEEYFNRQIQLWGLEKQKNLASKHIVIIGCGGLGCSLGIALGASGIGKITLVDFDEVGIHNIHRQIGFTTKDEGKKKSFVLKGLLVSRCPYTTIEAIDGSFEDFKALDIKDVDLILDATDNLPTRATIDNYAKENNIPWIYGSVEEFHGQICFFEKASFESSFQVTDRTPNGIACPIVMNIASIQANLTIKYLIGDKVTKDMLYYVHYDDNGVLKLQNFMLPS
jgi:adenylyltransferase/sulfurtransferase